MSTWLFFLRWNLHCIPLWCLTNYIKRRILLRFTILKFQRPHIFLQQSQNNSHQRKGEVYITDIKLAYTNISLWPWLRFISDLINHNILPQIIVMTLSFVFLITKKAVLQMTLIWRFLHSAGLSPWLPDHTTILLLNSCNLITTLLLVALPL